MSLLTKNLHGTFYKILIAAIFIINCFAYDAKSYETVIIKYPDKPWVSIFYQKQADETIAQLIPPYDYRDNWGESTVFHAYRWAKGSSCKNFMNNLMGNVYSQNKNVRTQVVKNDYNDAITMWCSEKPSQCEIVRVTRSYEGLISMHYINRDVQNFIYKRDMWLNIIRDAKIYYSYYRWDRVLSKASTIEL